MTIARDPVIRTSGAVTVTGRATGGPIPEATTGRRRPGGESDRRRSLDAIALLDLAKDFGSRMPSWAGRHAEPLVERSYELLELTDDVEVWVIHWPTGGHLQLHDHGGSAGAFWVVGGSLEERFVTEGQTLRERRIDMASGAGFGPRYVHDVRNGGHRPATSVHAYSPPMPGMTFYRSTPSGLVADRSEYRTDPSWAP